MQKTETTRDETWWASLSKDFMPSLHRTKKEALEEAKTCRIAGDETAYVAKVKLVEVK